MKLLIVKLNAIGDLVIATPALRRLYEGLQDVHIDFLTTDWSAPAVRGNPCINRLIVIRNDVFFKPSPGTIFPTIGLLLKLRREKYDAAVVFHRHSLVEHFVRAAGISKRFCFNGRKERRSVYLDENRHSALTAWELADLAVRELGGRSVEPPDLNDLRYEWFVSTEERDQADEILGEAGLGSDEFIALLPGGGINPNVRDTVRRWSQERFIELARRIMNEMSLRIVLLGGESDREVADRVAEKVETDVVNLCGRFDLRISAGILKLSRLVVCNDTGPLHIAAGVGAPVVGIFGPTGVRLKLPPGEHSHAASLELPCSPCYFSSFRGCIFDKFRCLEELGVDHVMSVIRASLDKSNYVG